MAKKKQVSEETQAIIDKLVNEGKLLRQGGTNSIKSVKIDIAKFGDVFKSINDGVGQLNKSVTEMVGRAIVESKTDASRIADIAGSFGLSSEYVDLQTKAAEMQIDNMDEEARVLKEKLAQDKIAKAKSDEDAERNKPGKVGGLFNIVKDNKMNIVKYGLLGYAGFQIIRGALDQMFDGGFSKGLSKVGDTLTSINWEGIGAGLSSVSSFVVDNPWLSTLGAGLLGFAGLSALMPDYITTGIGLGVGKMAMNAGDMKVPSGKGFFGKGKIGFGLGGILLAATGLLLPMLGKTIMKEMGGYTEADFANAKTDPGFWQMLGGVGQGALAGAPIGMMFGPGGLMIGAIMGGVGSLLYSGLGYIQREFIDAEKTMARKATGKVAKIQETIAAREALIEKLGDGSTVGMTQAEVDAVVNSTYKTRAELEAELGRAQSDSLVRTEEAIAEATRRLEKSEAGVLKTTKTISTGPYGQTTQVKLSGEELQAQIAARNKRESDLKAERSLLESQLAELQNTVSAENLRASRAAADLRKFEDNESYFDRFTRTDQEKAELERLTIAANGGGAVVVVNNVDGSTNVGGSTVDASRKSLTNITAGDVGGDLGRAALPTG